MPKTMENMIVSKVFSFTKNREYCVCVSNDYLKQDDRVLFIDDFLANGNAGTGKISHEDTKVRRFFGRVAKATQTRGSGKTKQPLSQLTSLANARVPAKK